MVSIQNKVRLQTASHQAPNLREDFTKPPWSWETPPSRGERRACHLCGWWPAASGKAQSFLSLSYLCGLSAQKQKKSFGFLLAFTSGIAFASLFHGWCGPGVTYSTSSVEERGVEASRPGPQLPPEGGELPARRWGLAD